MTTPSGDAEKAIRAVAVARIRERWPNGRLIHELNVDHGKSRADIAVVTDRRLVLFEIKSARDSLSRLSGQLATFREVAHEVIIVADACWSHVALHKAGASRGEEVWSVSDGGAIDICPRYARQGWVWHEKMLLLLWRAELRAVCSRLNVSCGPRSSRPQMVDDIMTACRPKEIEAEVLLALRTRPFANADEPQHAPSCLVVDIGETHEPSPRPAPALPSPAPLLDLMETTT